MRSLCSRWIAEYGIWKTSKTPMAQAAGQMRQGSLDMPMKRSAFAAQGQHGLDVSVRGQLGAAGDMWTRMIEPVQPSLRRLCSIPARTLAVGL